MPEQHELVESLARCVSGIAEAETPSDVFRALLDGARLSCPRSGVFLARKGALRGWGSAGYAPDPTGRFRALSIPLGPEWPARLADSGRPVRETILARDGGSMPDFGQPPCHESCGFSVRVTGKVLAVIVLERNEDETPWIPSAVELLVRAAQIRLELDLSRRKLQKLAESGSAATKPGPAEAGEQSRAAEPAAEAGTGGETDAAGPSAAGPENESARRFARLVATDIRLYNEESVILGRRNADLSHRLKEQLERGKETFQRRFPDLGTDGERILWEAYVKVLAGGDPKLFAAE